MHALEKELRERVAAGLKRKSLTTCSRWAEACRIMPPPFPGPWTFTHHPWLREMHDSNVTMNVCQKAAQVGFTEYALNKSFFTIDVKRQDVLYVLPAKIPDAKDFSIGRFDVALELSPHIGKLFSDVRNIGHKRAGTSNLYIRGSRSRSGLKSIPVGLIILDEVDEMTQQNIPLALERAAGQVEWQAILISTPTIDNEGINKYYKQSTQENFFFKCVHCGKYTNLIFPQCLEIVGEHENDPRVEESFLKCKECSGKLEHETKPEWLAKGIYVPGFSDREIRGFHISQLYSCVVTPQTIARSYFRAMYDPTEEQELYNSKLGLPHVVASGQLTDSQIDACIGSHRNGKVVPSSPLITMGIDIGTWCHFEIDEWFLPGFALTIDDLNIYSQCRVIKFGKVLHFEELDPLMREFGVNFAVIDAHPERRKAFEFATRHYGRVRMCFYGVGVQGKQIHVSTDAQPEPLITVDRTSWLDLSLGRFRKGQEAITLPMDVSQEYRRQVKALVRIYDKDKHGNPIGRYTAGTQDDHFAHSRNYAEIALCFAATVSQSQNITESIL